MLAVPRWRRRPDVAFTAQDYALLDRLLWGEAGRQAQHFPAVHRLAVLHRKLRLMRARKPPPE